MFTFFIAYNTSTSEWLARRNQKVRDLYPAHDTGILQTSARHVDHELLKVHKYHGIRKDIDLDSLVEHDVILTTYATLASGFKKRTSLLQQIRWFRVVLDEGMTSALQVFGSSEAEILILQPMQYATTPQNNSEPSTPFILSAAGASLEPQYKIEWRI